MKKHHVFQKVAGRTESVLARWELALNDNLSGDVCQNKWENMLKALKTCEDQNSRTGETLRICPFLAEISNLVGESSSVRPRALAESTSSEAVSRALAAPHLQEEERPCKTRALVAKDLADRFSCY